MNGIIEVKALSFSYGEKRVFENLTFDIKRGEVFCLLGPNGCGKTTLIDCLMALHRPSGGNIDLCGRPLAGYKRHEIAQKVAFVPQIHSPSFPYTVKEVVLMGRTAYTGAFSAPGKKDEEIAIKAIGRVGMADFADRAYTSLSGGEMKLVLLARALGQESDVIIMDEPTAHLDFRNELLFLETIGELVRNNGISVLIATHSPTHAFYFEGLGIPARAALMSGGGFYAMDLPGKCITEESIAEVYGVKAKIGEEDCGGRKIKTVSLLHTI